MKRDESLVLDILRAIQNILNFVEGLTKEEFLADEQLTSAVLYQFIVVGEATYRISKPFIEAHPDIEWPMMRGMRNRLAHGYDEIDYDVVWETIQSVLKGLAEKLKPLAPPDESNAPPSTNE